MTKERAIDLCRAIDQYLCAGNPIWDTAEIHDAISMATEALQVQKTGKWLEKERVYSEENHIEDWQSCCCSVCGHYDTRPYMYYFDEPNYCSYCGARMVGEEE